MNMTMFSIAVTAAALGAATIVARRDGTSADIEELEKREGLHVATFAGGCFWGVEAAFEKQPGVAEAVSGYTGGHTKHPAYKDVCSGKTGHTEAVRVYYDPGKISYADLLDVFWKKIHPTRSIAKPGTRGWQYRSAIFYHTAQQKRQAEMSRKRLQDSGGFSRPVVTPIEPAVAFYPAEDYHQNYHAKHAVSCAAPQSTSDDEDSAGKPKEPHEPTGEKPVSEERFE